MKRLTDENDCLMLGGVSASALKEQYGTPLYVMDEQKIRESMRCYTAALRDGYRNHGLICYASKAFSCKEIYRIASAEGVGADVVSLGELYTAQQSGMNLSTVCMHGNNKGNPEIMQGISGGARIVADNLEELERINKAAKEVGKKAKIMLRIKPGIEAHTHDFIRTGQIDSKFGFALETGEALAAVKKALEMSENIELTGIHCHIGSQILASDSFVLAAEVMFSFLAEIKKETKAELPELNLGGGFGIPYTSDDTPLDIGQCLHKVFDAVRSVAKKHGLNLPFLIFEPGRSIVAEAGTTLYTVGSIKTIPSIRTYVAVDGGMCDNIRYALYKSKYEMAIANKFNEPKNTVVTVAGKCCESGDLLGEKVKLQQAEEGDILAVFCTGAYNFSMYTGYNRTLRPPVVMVNGGKSRIIVKKQTLEQLVEGDI